MSDFAAGPAEQEQLHNDEAKQSDIMVKLTPFEVSTSKDVGYARQQHTLWRARRHAYKTLPAQTWALHVNVRRRRSQRPPEHVLGFGKWVYVDTVGNITEHNVKQGSVTSQSGCLKEELVFIGSFSKTQNEVDRRDRIAALRLANAPTPKNVLGF